MHHGGGFGGSGGGKRAEFGLRGGEVALVHEHLRVVQARGVGQGGIVFAVGHGGVGGCGLVPVLHFHGGGGEFQLRGGDHGGGNILKEAFQSGGTAGRVLYGNDAAEGEARVGDLFLTVQLPARHGENDDDHHHDACGYLAGVGEHEIPQRRGFGADLGLHFRAEAGDVDAPHHRVGAVGMDGLGKGRGLLNGGTLCHERTPYQGRKMTKERPDTIRRMKAR